MGTIEAGNYDSVVISVRVIDLMAGSEIIAVMWGVAVNIHEH